MKTNFFRLIARLNLTGDLHLILRPSENNGFVVSVLLKNEQCGDEAKKLIPPLNLRGTAEELDLGFYENIEKPLQTASGLMVNMESFMKQVEEAKKKSAMEKETRKKTRANSPNLDDNLELHPLKGMITCPECRRKIGCYGSRGNG